MAESEESKPSCTFLFKKAGKKFAARKRKASDSDKGEGLQLINAVPVRIKYTDVLLTLQNQTGFIQLPAGPKQHRAIT